MSLSYWAIVCQSSIRKCDSSVVRYISWSSICWSGTKRICGKCHVMACSLCSSHELDGGINANFARDVTLKSSTGQSHVWLVIHDGPSYVLFDSMCCYDAKVGPSRLIRDPNNGSDQQANVSRLVSNVKLLVTSHTGYHGWKFQDYSWILNFHGKSASRHQIKQIIICFLVSKNIDHLYLKSLSFCMHTARFNPSPHIDTF